MIGIALTLGRAVWSSFMGRALAIGLAALAALSINNIYQRSIGGDKRETKIVNASNQKAKERVRKVNKIRRNIKPSTAWKRLQSEYANPD